MTTSINISPDDLEIVQQILAEHVPELEVQAFGSRATWTAREYSDLDLVLMTAEPLDIKRLGDMQEAFVQSDLPFQVDIVDWASTSESFQQVIEKEFAVVQDKPRKEGRWPKVPLSKIINLIGGGTPRRNNTEYWGGSIPWLSIKDFNHDRRYVDTTEESITKLGLENSNTKLLSKDDLIVSARGTVGAISQLSQPMAFNQSCYGINSKTDYTTNDFLYYLIKYHIDNFKRISHGAVFDTITRKTFQHIDVNLPSLPEQHTISHILGILDDKIELNRKMSETLEEMAQALFKSWFVDFDPVRAKMEGRWRRGESLPRLPANLWGLFPDRFTDSEMGRIPEGWGIIPLPEVIDYKEGPGIRNWQYTNSEEGTHFINIRCIQDGDIVLSDANRIRDEEANGKYAHFHLKEWDIVISTSGTLGRSAIVRREHLPLVLNTSVIRFRPIKGKTLFSYLNGYLNSPIFLDELKSMASGSVQKNFGPTHLKKMSVLCPKFNCMKQYDRFVGSLLQNLIKRRTENDSLSTLRDILLPKLISGSIRLKDTEKLIETVI